MAGDVYVRLREYLDALPAGFPETPTGVEIKILKKMFTPEQAELTVKLSKHPESAADIARRTNMDEADVADRLEEMAQKGLIFRVWEGDRRFYHAFHFLVGLYEFQVNRLDREFCELFEAYLPYFYVSMAGQTGQMRVIPVASSLGDESTIAPYNRVRSMIDNETLFAVTNCICRQEQGLLGNECKKPKEVCLMFGKFAQFYIDNDNARQLTKKEVHGILDHAEANGLVLSPTNTQRPEAICCCCACCCPTLRGIKMMSNPGEIMSSGYHSRIDGDQCTGCGECIDVCPMDAIEDVDGSSEVKTERCIGCGLCADRCPVEAISMKERDEKRAAPVPTLDDLLAKISLERGLQQ